MKLSDSQWAALKTTVVSPIWGKILGGAAGFALGGPFGAFLGAIAGHAVDRLAGRIGTKRDRVQLSARGVPSAGQMLLPFLLPKKLRQTVPGDLQEEFEQYSAMYGEKYAIIWYWWQVGGIAIQALLLCGGIGWAVWIVQKIGALVR
jgi:hypothetical protein